MDRFLVYWCGHCWVGRIIPAIGTEFYEDIPVGKKRNGWGRNQALQWLVAKYALQEATEIKPGMAV